MIHFITANEPLFRLGATALVFTLMASWELIAPRRALRIAKQQRWTANLLLVLVNTAVLRVFFPTAAVGLALTFTELGWGLLPAAGLKGVTAAVLALIMLDFAIYTQHVVFHRVPILWRLHRVHHADPDLDVTSGTRFHPIEIGLSMAIKAVVIGVIGAPAVAVLAFEMLLNLGAMFNHSNVAMPKSMDRVLRWFVVTPDMHRVHHSVLPTEHHPNFGFNLPVWDRLFGTYLDQPAAGHRRMQIGLADVGAAEAQTLMWMLKMPLAPFQSAA